MEVRQGEKVIRVVGWGVLRCSAAALLGGSYLKFELNGSGFGMHVHTIPFLFAVTQSALIEVRIGAVCTSGGGKHGRGGQAPRTNAPGLTAFLT